LVLFVSAPAKAHSLWLESPDNRPAADQPLRLDVGFNEGFEVVDIIKEGEPNINPPTLAGEAGEVAVKKGEGANYVYATEAAVPKGGYVGFVDYKPFVMGHGEGAKNRYFMTGKAVFDVGGAGGDFVTKPQGKAALEIVPLKNPSGLRPGEILPVLVLYDGKPLPRATILGDFRGFNPAGSWGLAKAFYCLTDKDGKADFIPARGGQWILKVRHALDNEDKTEAAQTVHLANLTFFVAD
jgi:uncharacterized GH25 family protein